MMVGMMKEELEVSVAGRWKIVVIEVALWVVVVWVGLVVRV